jgi:DNA-binding transcriptional regulator YhcF (GntR family)
MQLDINTIPKWNYYGKNSKIKFYSEMMEHYILNNLKVGTFLPSKEEFSSYFGISLGSAQYVYSNLKQKGIISSKQHKGSVVGKGFLGKERTSEEPEKLLDWTIGELRKMQSDEGRFPTLKELSKKMEVSTKIVYDAKKILSSELEITSRRGRYGSYKGSNFSNNYKYEEVEDILLSYIKDTCVKGDKLPSISKLSILLGYSTIPIFKALHNLEHKGICNIKRGKAGGSYIL